MKAWNMTNKLNGVPIIIIALFGIIPIFKLNGIISHIFYPVLKDDANMLEFDVTG